MIAARPYKAEGDELQLVDARTSPTVGDVFKVQETAGALDFDVGTSARLLLDKESVVNVVSPVVSCAGRERIVLKGEFGLNDGDAIVRVWLADENSKPGWFALPTTRIVNSGQRASSGPKQPAQGTNYLGSVATAPTYGAKLYAVQLVVISRAAPETVFVPNGMAGDFETIPGNVNRLTLWGAPR